MFCIARWPAKVSTYPRSWGTLGCDYNAFPSDQDFFSLHLNLKIFAKYKNDQKGHLNFLNEK